MKKTSLTYYLPNTYCVLCSPSHLKLTSEERNRRKKTKQRQHKHTNKSNKRHIPITATSTSVERHIKSIQHLHSTNESFAFDGVKRRKACQQSEKLQTVVNKITDAMVWHINSHKFLLFVSLTITFFVHFGFLLSRYHSISSHSTSSPVHLRQRNGLGNSFVARNMVSIVFLDADIVRWQLAN